jgi:hypothetical protein
MVNLALDCMPAMQAYRGIVLELVHRVNAMSGEVTEEFGAVQEMTISLPPFRCRKQILDS